MGPTNDVDIYKFHYDELKNIAFIGQTRVDLLSNLFAGNVRNKGKRKGKVDSHTTCYEVLFCLGLYWGPNPFLILEYYGFFPLNMACLCIY